MMKGNFCFVVIALYTHKPPPTRQTPNRSLKCQLASRIKKAYHFNSDGIVDCRYTATVQILTAAGRYRVSRMDFSYFSYPEEDTFTLFDASVRITDEPAQPPMKAKVDIRTKSLPSFFRVIKRLRWRFLIYASMLSSAIS
ncbi:hypothetical protein BG74_01935 [Sodalis-like endosymbiont of Proechinophthirus fluctus]|uniref:hypothetical protein n=1 Tax=Sodalis-like endosymbiont of Proechinophthirus fluctus TaxID=1462730 RepID=UPI0007A7D8D1|nr:hypothetical protein [Sodalis-like endosymbiont of Proechinophthirus fluctus]KYP97604.1 hypothetical protein BG74_01935 [Sodalis-like endosymbiont of Proechinophthirus fluctus]